MENQDNFPEDRFVVYEKLVKSNFAFLLENYGFKLSNIEREGDSYIALKYLSEKVFVNLHYGSPSFELDFCFGRVGIDDKLDNNGFTSSDLLLLNNNDKWVNYKLYSAHSYKNLCQCLPKLAALLEACGTDYLNGEPSAYEKMLFAKKRNISQWYDEQELKQVKKAALKAWNNKDYTKFIEIIESISNALSPSEKKKLEYARKHI